MRLSTDPVPPDITPYVVVAVGLLMLIAGFGAGAVTRRLTIGRAALITFDATLSAGMTFVMCLFPDVGMFPGVFFAGAAIGLIVIGGLLTVILIATRSPQ